MGWLVGCRFKSNCPLVEPGTIGGMPSVGGLSKGSKPLFTRVSEKTTENYERLSRQVQPGNELGTYRLPVLSVEPLRHWLGLAIWDVNFTIS